MKVYELKYGTFLVQHNKYRDNYFIYEGCDGMYGKFIEVNKNGENFGEPVIDQKRGYVYFSCSENINTFNFEIISIPKGEALEKIKTTIKNILSSWFK